MSSTSASTSRPWLDRYVDPLPIRSRGAFHLVSARRAGDGAPRVVVVPGPSAERARVAAALAEVERVHALIDHPLIPRVTARDEASGTPFLELSCDATLDGVECVRLLADAHQRIPYAASDGFIASLRLALQAAHAVIDPATGAPICLGRLSPANLLFSPAGRWYLVGFGRNFPIEKESGAMDGWAPFFQAPELVTGAAPTPVGDYTALLLFMRSLLPYVEITGTLARFLRGDVGPADLELLDLLQWFDRRILGEAPPLRPSIDEAVAVSDRIRALLGVTPDPELFVTHVASVIEPAEEAPSVAGGAADPELPALLVGPDAAWFEVGGGERQRLGGALRRVLAVLLDRHAVQPGAPLSIWDILEAGWPGERPVVEAGANRVYVAIARLRGRGLRDVIERFDDGYRLAPGTVIRAAEPGKK
jgi:hypothetical protein